MASKTATKQHENQEESVSSLAIELVSIGPRTLNLSYKNQTVDNFGVKWPPHNEFLTRLPLTWGFFVDVDRLDENATLKIGIFIPEDDRVCPVVWNHGDIDQKKLHGTIWYWNLTDVRRTSISMIAAPQTLRPNYGNRSEVQMGSSIGVYRDSDGSLHFVINEKDQGIAVDKTPRNFFYGWLRLGGNGDIKITHRMDLSLGYYSRQVLGKGIPKKESKAQKPKTNNPKKTKATTKKEKGKEKENEKASVQQTPKEPDQQATPPTTTNTDERAVTSGTFRVYRMTKKPRGHCVIISNSKFHDHSRNRQGAEIDEKAMKSLFEELHFKVEIKKNLTARQIENEVYAYARKDHQDFDAFVCIIMTHGGDNNILLGVDERKTKLEDLMSEVKPTNCPSLQGKPKFFIVQACRGEHREDVASSYCRSSFGSTNSTYNRAGFGVDTDGLSNLSTDSTLPRAICPIEGDFLLAFATTPGYVALRDRHEGSIFVQVLVDVFRKYHNNHHAVELLTEVNRQVAERVEELTDGTYWQMPAPSFTLRALFHL